MAATLTGQEFEEKVVRDRQLTVVDFWAPWCTHCRRLDPAYEKVTGKLGDRILAAKINIDEEMGLAENYEVEVIPTLIVFKDGEEAGRVVNPESKARIEEFIEAALG